MSNDVAKPVPPSAAVTNAIGVVLILLIPVLLWALVTFWPGDAPSGEGQAALVSILWGRFEVDRDVSFFAVAAIAGALGSYIHAATSFSAFVGNEQLGRTWVWWYLLRIPIGAALGVIFALFLRAGFLGGKETTPYVVAALGALSGMFSRQAIDKMKELFDMFFSSKANEERKDKLQTGVKPEVTAVTPKPVPKGPASRIVVEGKGFDQGAKVSIGDSART